LSYAQAMAKGWDAEQKGDFAAAIQAFEQAVKLRPGSAAALSELNWTAFSA
jgi:hypothetical protein